MEKILLAQFIAHIIADFFAQSDCLSTKKQEKGFCSWHLYVHSLIVFVMSFIMTFTWCFMLYAFAIAVTHFAIDGLKSFLEHKLKNRKSIGEDKPYSNLYLFFADQIVHLAIIYWAVSMYFCNNGCTPSYLTAFTTNQLLTVAGLLVCIKPTNVLIRSCLSSLDLCNSTSQSAEDLARDEGLARAGRWIGAIERIMTMALVMLQQYTAIGFIITAKSVLRYGDSKTGKTEYVLIGTLLSFGIALLIGIGIVKGGFDKLTKA